MHTSLTPSELSDYVGGQLAAFFPDGRLDRQHLRQGVESGLERLAHCFAHIHLKYYQRDGEASYDHLNTDQHAAFLYMLSRVLHKTVENTPLAAKVYALNKALHALDVFYEVELPAVFYFQHPVGTVIGRARFGNFLAVYQGVSIGADLEGRYPQLDEGVVLFGGARVIGRSRIGANSWVAPAAIIMDETFPPDSVLFGMPPATQRRPSRRDVIRDFFGRPAEAPP